LSRLNSTALLNILSLSLHSALVAIHVALLVVWSRGLENLVVFAVGNEPFVSRGIKVVSTTFGTVRRIECLAPVLDFTFALRFIPPCWFL
jgi:hypothetical protein